jgi:hypothetical protein
MGTGENLEFTGFQFHYNGARDSRFLARGSPCVRRKFSDHRLHLAQQDILFKSVLGRYGPRWPVRNDSNDCPDGRLASILFRKFQASATRSQLLLQLLAGHHTGREEG